MDSIISQTGRQACTEQFFAQKNKKYEPDGSSLLVNALNTVRRSVVNLKERTAICMDVSDEPPIHLKPHIILLSEKQELRLPANINQDSYQDLIFSIELGINDIKFRPSYNNDSVKEALYDFFEVIQNKIDFYHNKNSDNCKPDCDTLTVISETIRYLDEFKNIEKDKELNLDNLTQLINLKTLLIYSCPEVADTDILNCFLRIDNNSQKFKLSTIYSHFKSQILDKNKSFSSTLHSKAHFETRYTFGLPKLAAFFLSINYNIKTDKNPVEKVVRRFDEFIQKMNDFFLHANQVMHDKNIVFSDLTILEKNKMIRCSAEFAMILSENGLLLEKANFSYLLYTFDSVLGGFFNSLNEVSELNFNSSKSNRREEKRHLFLIADDIIRKLYDLPHSLHSIIKNKKSPSADNKTFVYEVIQELKNNISGEVLSQLDRCIIDLDHNLMLGDKLMALTINEEEEKVAQWRAAAEASLKVLDDGVDKSDDPMVTFNKKLGLRKAILKGFDEIIGGLYKELGRPDNFLYDACVARLMHQVSLELKKEASCPPLTEEKLAILFRRTCHSISTHIDGVKETFAKSLLKSYQIYSMRVNSDHPTGKPLPGKTKRQTEEPAMQRMERGESVAGPSSTDEAMTSMLPVAEATTLDRLEETKELFGTMLCAYSKEFVEVSDQRSLVERLKSEGSRSARSAGKSVGKYTTDIHKLTTGEIFRKIQGRPSVVSIKKKFSKITDGLLRPEISRHKANLVPAENIRKKNHIIMKENDHENLRILCQCALQKTKLKIQDQSSGDTCNKLCVFLDQQIQQIGTINETRIMDPFKWLINTINNVYSPASDAILKLKDDLEDYFNKLHIDYNEFSKMNYHMLCNSSWDNHLKNYQNCSNYTTFENIIRNSDQQIPEEYKQFIVSLFKTYEECFTETFQSKLSKKLPPSLETVNIYQKVMSFHLGCSEIIQGNDLQQVASDDEYYAKFRTGIINYNDHLKSLSEQMASDLSRKPDRHAKRLDQLDQTFAKTKRILQDKALFNMTNQFDELSSTGETLELLKQFNEHLDKLFELGFFEQYFGKESRIFKFLGEVVGYCSKNKSFIPGAFVAAAVVNIFFTAPGTNLLRELQKSAPDLFNALMSMKQIFSQMEANVPGLIANASMVYSMPFNATAGNGSCTSSIYENLAVSGSVSFSGAMGSAEDGAVSFLQSLYYKDSGGCPTGGSDSFPPGSFINWPNALTTVVSISSGAIACFSGWAQDVDGYVKGVKEYSALPNIFQDLSPEITEKLLLQSVRQLPSRKADTETVYPGPETACEFCLDGLDTLLNKTVKYTSRSSVLYALNWGLYALRYMTIAPFSMAAPKRPHSLEEFKERVCIAASDRKFKTLIRMLGYNSAKEFIDVFSTKSGTLAFLLFLKEADFFEAVNEKAGIADYQVMKAKYDTFLNTLDALSKNAGVVNQYQVKLLKETYGSELINNILGPDANLIEVEKAVQTQANAMFHRIAGITSLGLIYAAQCANLYHYTATPWIIARQVVDKLQGKTVSLSETAFDQIRKASRKTISREYTPNDLSYEQQFWHYIFAERASTKFQQSFLLWGIKETINLSMYWNATAHERDMGINTINWELLGCMVAYLAKDSTGMCARFATLLDDESLRTFFSLLDKLDSPLAEKILSEVGRVGLHSPQSVNNTVSSMMEEVILSSTGDIRDVHRIANKKYQEMEQIGITALKRTAQMQEKEIEKIMESIDWPPDQASSTAEKSAQHLPPYFQQSTLALREALQANMVSHGMPLDDNTQKAVNRLDEFMNSNAYGVDYNNPVALMRIFGELQEKIPIKAVGAWSYQKLIARVRSLDPEEKTRIRLQSLQSVINQRVENTAFRPVEGWQPPVNVAMPVTRQPTAGTTSGLNLEDHQDSYV